MGPSALEDRLTPRTGGALRVHPAVQVVHMAEGRVQIRTPVESLTIGREGPLALELLRLCAPSCPRNELLAALEAAGHARHVAATLIELLERRGVLSEEHWPAGEDMLLLRAGFQARATLGQDWRGYAMLRERALLLLGQGRLPEALREELRHLGVPLRDAAEPGVAVALRIACGDCDDPHAFRALNHAALAAAEPILFACLLGQGVRLGPLVVPGQTACYDCFFHRLRAGLAFREEFDAQAAQRERSAEGATPDASPLLARLAAVLLCAQIANYLLGLTQHCVANSIVELNATTLELKASRLLKLPRCDACGLAEHRAPPAACREWA